ncbi:hypothetical protein DFR74_10536 [Nocardia puris]|uniref:Uncharacterized protein n=1 Tax=Nocardia puris TaxID=208602 RepID=A0A366DMU9_9NOCA|nr:hypothetical protein DFR74_10536 [Nocardia puris]
MKPSANRVPAALIPETPRADGPEKRPSASRVQPAATAEVSR